MLQYYLYHFVYKIQNFYCVQTNGLSYIQRKIIISICRVLYKFFNFPTYHQSLSLQNFRLTTNTDSYFFVIGHDLTIHQPAVEYFRLHFRPVDLVTHVQQWRSCCVVSFEHSTLVFKSFDKWF